MSPILVLYDDAGAARFDPLSRTRPVGELLFGAATFRARTERWLGLTCAGHLSGPALAGFDEHGGRPALLALDSAHPRVLVSGRFAVDPAVPRPDLDSWIAQADAAGGSLALFAGGEPVGWVLSAGTPTPDAERLLAGPDPDSAALPDVDGTHVPTLWDLMAGNPDQLRADLTAWANHEPATLPEGVHVLGNGGLTIAPSARIEPGVVLDTRDGPIRVEEDVQILAFTRLAGPSWIGPGTQIFGGTVGSVSLGPVCKVRGEIEETVITGYSNKAHDGFLGHAVLGRWVNLGAGTTNSDLKNNYGKVRLRLPGGDVDTGLKKVGCFIGDHAKTGIGTVLNTGTVVGAGANLFGGTMPPSYVPPFHWGSGSDLVPYRLDKFLEVAKTVMERRSVDLTPGVREVLARLWAATFPDAS